MKSLGLFDWTVSVLSVMFLVLGLRASPPIVTTTIEACRDSTVVYFSEGTAWRSAVRQREVWVGWFNPTAQTQNIIVTVYPQGLPVQSRSIPTAAFSRDALNVYDTFWASVPGREINFATEIRFQSLGVGSLAIWDPALIEARYPDGAYGCVSTFVSPYEPTP